MVSIAQCMTFLDVRKDGVLCGLGRKTPEKEQMNNRPLTKQHNNKALQGVFWSIPLMQGFFNGLTNE